MTIHNIENAKTKDTAMVAEITKTYARKNEVPTQPSTKLSMNTAQVSGSGNPLPSHDSGFSLMK